MQARWFKLETYLMSINLYRLYPEREMNFNLNCLKKMKILLECITHYFFVDLRVWSSRFLKFTSFVNVNNIIDLKLFARLSYIKISTNGQGKTNTEKWQAKSLCYHYLWPIFSLDKRKTLRSDNGLFRLYIFSIN